MASSSFAPLLQHRGIVAHVAGADIDTDQIVPRQFLGVADRNGLGNAFLHDWRYNLGVPRPDFVLNRPPFDRATILLVDRNFGCGSSREHAAWAVTAAGLRVLLGLGFGSMFSVNCANNGVLCAIIGPAFHAHLAALPAGSEVEIDLVTGHCLAAGEEADLVVDQMQRACLMQGMSSTDMALTHAADVQAFEATHGF